MSNGSLKIEIPDMGNAAFSPDSGYEVTRILKEIADDITGWHIRSGDIRDINGNKVGEWHFDAPEEEEL